ncbi:hypothetical protein [Nonomuraea sp. NPDC049784]|uniref:hypothetical protein n=1 Tax=Nonomuraea sp. NPDC049784 TaxID=3154361 RepID=UPI0033FE4BE5
MPIGVVEAVQRAGEQFQLDIGPAQHFGDGIIGWTITRSPFQPRAGLLTLGATTSA